MKKLLILTSITIFLVSCASDSVSDLVAVEEEEPGDVVTFVDDVQPVIANTCFPCHDNPTSNGAPNSMTTFAEVLEAVENRNLVGRVNSVTSPMPPSGLLPEPLRQVFQDWVDDGLLESAPQ